MKILHLPFQKIQHEYISMPIKYLINSEPKDILGFIEPDFANNKDEWSFQQKKNFVENLFLGINVQNIIITTDYSGQYDNWLLDGFQRLSAIKDFGMNKFSIFNDCYYDDFINKNLCYVNNPENEINKLTPYQSLSCCHLTITKMYNMTRSQIYDFYKQIQYNKPEKFKNQSKIPTMKLL